MTRHIRYGVGVLLVAVSLIPVVAADQTGSTSGAAAAVKANPELANGLSKELGSSPEQAAGAAGALFGLAKSRLTPEQFTQISRAVPGMNALLGAAPAPAAGGATGAAAQAAGAAGGLTGVAQAFSKLGLSPDMVAKAVPFLTQYASKLGGPAVGKLLAGALK